MTDTALALEIRDLKKIFRSDSMLSRIEVLRGVDLSVRRGEVMGFLGPNGAGKTTTLKIVMGLIRATSGSARIFGSPVSDPATRARVGFLPEQPYFYDYLTVEELLRLVADLHGLAPGVRRERVERVIQRVGLEARRTYGLRKLSKGWLQRVGMAQALINDPDLLILDEPMSGLDPIGRREIRELIREIADEGKTVCLSSHILSDAELLCDRVAILVDGKVQHEGSLNSFGGGSAPIIDVVLTGIELSALDGGPVPTTAMRHRDDQLMVRVEDPDQVTRFVEHAIGRGAKLVSVTPRQVGLEDIFEQAVASSAGASE